METDDINQESSGNLEDKIVQDMHRLFLEALRHREQDIIRFLAILGPALTGYIWLLKNFKSYRLDDHIFTAGTIGILFILFVGAWYSVALGYNFRYVTMQIAKFDHCKKIKKYILKSWPREVSDFKERYRYKIILKLCCATPVDIKIPWCTPPEIIKIFWYSFILLIVGIIISAGFALKCNLCSLMVIIVGLLSILLTLYWPIHYGKKLEKMCDQEVNKWNVNEWDCSDNVKY